MIESDPDLWLIDVHIRRLGGGEEVRFFFSFFYLI